MIGRLKLYGMIAGLLAIVIITAGLNRGSRQALRQAIQTNRKQEDMKDAAANTSRRRDDVARNMRDGHF